MATTTVTYPDDDRPVIAARWSHWVRLRWPDGREQISSAARAVQLGAIEQDETTAPTDGAER